MERATYFSAIKSQQKIDADKGVISGVSVITVGQAAGCNSGTWIDSVTLSQIDRVAKTYPDGIRVKLSQIKEHDGSVAQVVGILKNFRTDGDQERADLHLLSSSPHRAFILEMAATMPGEFGLSVVIPKEFEKVNGKDCLRCSEIYSIDLVEEPAANAGLFSSQPTTKNMSSIKYAKGESGDHAKDCECKECMSASSKKAMTAMFATIVGLDPEKATETEIATAFKASRENGDVAALSKKLDETKAELSRIQASSENSLALSKKGEIESLLAEASRAGKVVPFDNDDLFTEKDGKVTIKMEPVALSKVIAKLSAGTVKTSHTVTLTAKTDKGEIVDRRKDPEAFKAFLASKREESATRYLATRN